MDDHHTPGVVVTDRQGERLAVAGPSHPIDPSAIIADDSDKSSLEVS